ncbi:MAG: FAD:protein FMN transferase [Actinobacteria bacterium]|nr:FAD:protein FMN transferase [Actinomycetota bacterium]
MRTTSFAALGTSAFVAVADDDALDHARATLEREVRGLDAVCSRFRADSELARANARSGERVDISPQLGELVSVALRARVTSHGCVDPTLGADLRACGYDRTFALVRSRGRWQIDCGPARLRPPQPVELDTENLTLRVPAGVELDLGATAKAWCADWSADLIARSTGSSVLVSLGGDIAVAGPPAAWPIRIAEDHSAPLAAPGPVVEITSGGLATSSTSVRRWQTDRGEAHHILDPRSGRPVPETWRSVSVAAPTCVEANVAATAAIVLGDEAPSWLEATATPARLVRANGRVSFVSGWPSDRRAA